MLTNNGFLETKDISFVSITNKNSFATNFKNIYRNFTMLGEYLSMQKAFIAYMFGLINAESLIGNIVAQMQITKTVLNIKSLQTIDSIDIQEINGIIYTIKRLDEMQFQITASVVDWRSDMLLVHVKDMNNIVVYPLVDTNNNKILIYFNDGAVINYKVFIV